jgi:phage gp46-like protein
VSTFATYYLPPESNGALVARPRAGQGVAISDVRLYHAADGGEIDFVGGEPVMSDGLETAVYLSLFGGNAEDSGLPGDRSKQWWGNLSELVTARQLRSETQYLLDVLPPTTGNLRRIENAVQNDLAWLLAAKLATDVAALASMPARNSVALDVAITVATGERPRFTFPSSWGVKA